MNIKFQTLDRTTTVLYISARRMLIRMANGERQEVAISPAQALEIENMAYYGNDRNWTVEMVA